MDEDDDLPKLPADTLRALQEFHAEKDALAKKFEDLKSQSESAFSQEGGGDAIAAGGAEPQRLSMSLFGEDWNASQFWYTDSTATALARQLLEGATASTRIAVVSAPSVYVALRNLLLPASSSSSSSSPSEESSQQQRQRQQRPEVRLFEYDKRFEVLGKDFVFYDFRQPLRFPQELKGKFDRIICDPPFLSEDCQAKTAVTVRALAAEWRAGTETTGEDTGGGEKGERGLRLISCTGERMGETLLRLYGKVGLRATSFEVEHTKGLSNEFRCYANFECGDWVWREGE